jgi:hypothetical protein
MSYHEYADGTIRHYQGHRLTIAEPDTDWLVSTPEQQAEYTDLRNQLILGGLGNGGYYKWVAVYLKGLDIAQQIETMKKKLAEMKGQ